MKQEQLTAQMSEESERVLKMRMTDHQSEDARQSDAPKLKVENSQSEMETELPATDRTKYWTWSELVGSKLLAPNYGKVDSGIMCSDVQGAKTIYSHPFLTGKAEKDSTAAYQPIAQIPLTSALGQALDNLGKKRGGRKPPGLPGLSDSSSLSSDSDDSSSSQQFASSKSTKTSRKKSSRRKSSKRKSHKERLNRILMMDEMIPWPSVGSFGWRQITSKLDKCITVVMLRSYLNT